MSNLSPDTTVTGSLDDRVGQILAVVRTVLGKPGLTADDEVMDHGGTSLSVVRILTELSRDLRLNVNPRDLDGEVSARSLAHAAR